MNQKGSVAIVLLVGLVIVLGGALGYTILMEQASKSDAVILPQDDSDIFKPAALTKDLDVAPEENIDALYWKTYTNAQYGFSFKYHSDWELEPTEFGADVSKILPDGSKLLLSVGQIGAISFNTVQDTKGTFLNHEAYFQTFTNCISEGGNSHIECYLKLVKVVLGEKQVSTQGIQQDIRADALNITYGVSKEVPRTPTVTEHVSYQTELQSIFDQNNAVFDEILGTVTVTKLPPMLQLTVITPNGGETFKAGQPIQIRWQPTQSSVFISVVGDPAQPYCLSPNQNYEQPLHGDVSGDSISLQIPPSLVDGNTCRFKIKVRSNTEASVVGQSDDYFTVTP